MSQTIWPLGLNLLNILQYILHNTTSSHIYLFFIKVDHFFLKEQYGSTHIVLDSSFSNDAQKSTYIIYTYIIYIYIYISYIYIYISIYWKINMAQTVFFWSEIKICKKILENKTQKYHVIKIDENFVEGQYGTIVLCEFVAVLIQKRKI